MQNAILALGGFSLLLLLLTFYYKRRVDALTDLLEEERSRSRSLSTVYGQINEQWFPLMDRYPYDSQYCRFLGTPVDGVQFEEDRIIFCEFKTNRSGLSPVQKRIKQLIQDRRVYWEEFYFTPD